MVQYPYRQLDKSHAAFSMIEIVVSTMLVGIVLVTALNSVRGSIKTWEATDNDLQRHALAYALIAEISAQPYADPEDPNSINFGTESGESSGNRADFDDVDDYDDWTKSPPEDPNGVSMSGMTGWTRSVDVKKLDSLDPTSALIDSAPDSGNKRITVTVIDSNGDSTVLNSIRSRQGAIEKSLGVDVQVVSNLSIQIASGGDGPVSRETNLVNHALDVDSGGQGESESESEGGGSESESESEGGG